jgi:hypothetical protein
MVCFQTKHPNLGKFWRTLEFENVGIFNGRLEYFTAIWYILWPFGNVVVIWHIPPPFWYIVSGKIWQPWYRV